MVRVTLVDGSVRKLDVETKADAAKKLNVPPGTIARFDRIFTTKLRMSLEARSAR